MGGQEPTELSDFLGVFCVLFLSGKRDLFLFVFWVKVRLGWLLLTGYPLVGSRITEKVIEHRTGS